MVFPFRPQAGTSASALALLLLLAAQQAEGILKELYLTRKICSQKNCINPVFPGVQDLSTLENQTWTKFSLSRLSQYLEFCGEIVNYDSALPKANFAAVKDNVANQDNQAAQMYAIHLAAMGVEPWDNVLPSQDPCAQSVARMACLTYFPRAQLGQDGVAVRYLRPCSTACESYVQACSVQCCDKSTNCVWNSFLSTPVQTQNSAGEVVLLTTGYVNGTASTGMCTDNL